MNFGVVTDSKKWDQFVASQPHSQFLQSWSWGEFQKAFGRRVWRVGMFEERHPERSEGSRSLNREILRRSASQDDMFIGAAQIIEHNLGLGMGYLYCPKGPIGKFPIEDLLNFIKTKIANYGTLFLRVEPSISQYLISNIQFLRVPSIQPSHTLILDLSKSEEELLNAMHPKTRYNLHLAERKGLKFGMMDDGFEKFWQLMLETAGRDKIKLHPKKYYQTMGRVLSKEQAAIKYLIFNIQYLDILLAGGIFIGFGDTFTYVHGASANQQRELMAPYLLHWQAIKFAKNHGYSYYDFGGVNPEDKNDFDYRSRWEGITRFKKGFGGEVLSFPGAYEVVLNRKGYRMYQLAKKIKSLLP